MFCCSVVPENNSLVWEEPSVLLDQEQAASPSSINSSASSSSLRLCCWVVSAPAADGNLETDSYSLVEVSFPPRTDPSEIPWAGISREADVGHCQRLASRDGSALLEP